MPVRNLADWPALRLEYIHGGVTVNDLALKYGLKRDTVKKRSDREHWGAERIKVEQKAIAEAAAQAATQRVSDLLQFNSDDLKIARAIRAQIARKLSRSTEANPIASSELRLIASAAEVAQRMGRLALGASTDNFGHAGQDGEGPVAVTAVPVADYLSAREKVLGDY